jgi:hypothetical protein
LTTAASAIFIRRRTRHILALAPLPCTSTSRRDLKYMALLVSMASLSAPGRLRHGPDPVLANISPPPAPRAGRAR